MNGSSDEQGQGELEGTAAGVGGLPVDRSRLSTEQRNEASMALHTLGTREIVDLIQEEDREVFRAMKRSRHLVARLIAAAEPGFVDGGRLIYVGAGTSGRLGVLDASEAPPTFCVEPGKIVGLIAGGDGALRRSSEGREDDPRGAWEELAGLKLSAKDTVIGIAAGGTTPYVLGAMEYCKTQLDEHARPTTGMIVCVNIEAPAHVDHFIVLKTGPEVLTGSTRMKAGTATKMTLNTISTTLMVRSGRVYQNLMVDVRATNDKLKDRAARIIATLTGISRQESFALLAQAGGVVKTAVVMHTRRTTREEAERLLEAANGRLGDILE
ncbi:MAG TPA: N-acetylmuramic acid 6-phosphate etherase [Phycisphaerales bacterium]|nr:N-acetylmuramic acid 6-phosphate etherase [Phycisphaerales bacterium]